MFTLCGFERKKKIKENNVKVIRRKKIQRIENMIILYLFNRRVNKTKKTHCMSGIVKKV